MNNEDNIYEIDDETLERFVNYLDKIGFYTAPASTKYHLANKGGLYTHSLNVANNLLYLTGKLNLKWEKERSPFLIGMFHDICKSDQYKFLPNGTIVRDETADQEHGAKSVSMLKAFFDLTEEEEACILYHMGSFTDRDKWSDYTNAIHDFPNVLWTHVADMMATHMDEVDE